MRPLPPGYFMLSLRHCIYGVFLVSIGFLLSYATFTAEAQVAHHAAPPPSEAPAQPPGVNVVPADALSQDRLQGVLPEAPTHPTLRMTPDKSEIVRLDADAATVVIGGPAHLSVLPDNARTLVLVPKAPGATYVTVLDKKSNVIMQRHVLVAGPAEKYLRIRKSCATSEDKNCQTTQVYYCPDMCHEIILSENDSDASESGADALGSTATASDALNQVVNEAESVSGDTGGGGGEEDQ